MANGTLPGIKACAFDAYGTLFDVHSAVKKHAARIGEVAGSLSSLWRAKQLEYAWLRSLMQNHADFWQVTGDALDYAMDASGVNDLALRDELMRSYLELEAYPEVESVLTRLKSAGLPLTILSNGSPMMLENAVSKTGLAKYFDRIISIEAVGVYKPHPRAYRLLCDHLELAPQEISFQSSNGWDIAGAANYGLTAIWINRLEQKPERLPAGARAAIESLARLPELIDSAGHRP